MTPWPDGAPFEPSAWPIKAARVDAWWLETAIMRDPHQAYHEGVIDLSELARRIRSGRHFSSIKTGPQSNRILAATEAHASR